jgi:DNA-binding NarL/FixJ family response regulator
VELELRQGSNEDAEQNQGNDQRAEQAARLIAKLTPRQVDVLNAMSDGLLNKQIACFLMINEKTVKMHRASVLRRLNVSHSAQAVRIAVEASFATPEACSRQ